MKRFVIMVTVLLLSIVPVVVFGQGVDRSLTIVSQIRVFPTDTTSAGNFSYVASFVRSGKYIFGATSNNNVIRSSDGGKTWRGVGLKFDFGFTLSIGVTDSGTILVYGPTSADPIWRSADGGNSWTAINTGAGRFFTNALDGSIIAGGQNSIYRSTDDGRTWRMVADTSLLHWNSAMSLFTTSKGAILMGVTGGSPDFYGIYRSTDDGFTWNFVNSGLPPAGDVLGYVNNFAETSDGTIFAATFHDGIYKSTDDGKMWSQTSSTFPVPGNPVFPCILASPNFGLLVSDGSNGTIMDGIIRSTNEGSTWTLLGFEGSQVGAMMQLDSTHLLANINGSIYILTLDFVTAVNEPPHDPITFTLSQNYPNPFNPTTSIQYQVASRQYVTLAVYNVLGQKVVSLVDGTVSPGTHEVRFDGQSLPSGVYLSVLRAGSFTETKKMVLIK